VELQPSTAGPPGTAAIGQTAQIPESSLSFTFFASSDSGFQVTFGGQNIPLVEYESTANYNIWGGDISAFAGESKELLFTGGGILDNIIFSTSPVPEPGTGGLILCGAVLFGFGRWRKAWA
jgi:hypothetical protein